jgi:hypothetical protein
MASVVDREYVKALKTFETQVSEATQIWFAASAMDEVAKRNRATLQAINLTPLFWITVRGALQRFTLIAIGRIFDQSHKTPKNIDTILRLTYEGRESTLSKSALEARKREGSANADEWIADYMARVHGPERADVRRLSKLVKKYRKIYVSQYEEIRNRHIAHTEIVDDAELAALYAKTNVRDLERLIVFLNKFHKALWELFHNGRRPRLRPMRFSAKSLVRKKLDNLRTHAVHEDTVFQTRQCLRMLTDAAIATGRVRRVRTRDGGVRRPRP